MLLDKGVQQIGDPTQCHAVAIDARAPKFDGGIITRLDCVVFGIVVNKHAAALLRRGRGHLAEALRDLGPARRGQPDQIAYIIFDASVAATCSCRRCIRRSQAPTHRANSRGKLDLDPEALETTVAEFNAAVRPGTFDHTILDDCRTEGLTPPKTPLGAADRDAALLRLSGAARHHLHLSRHAREQGGAHADDRRHSPPPTCSPPARSWPATCSARGYAAGIGMTIGSVFGRIAGREAAAMPATSCDANSDHAHLRAAGRSRPADDGLQFLPLLRGTLRGVPGHGDAPRVPRRRSQLPRQSLPWLRRLLLRLPVLAAARIQRQRAARRWRSRAPSPTRPMPGRAPSPACSSATGLRSA